MYGAATRVAGCPREHRQPDWLTPARVARPIGMTRLVALLFVFGSHVVRARSELHKTGKRLAMLTFFIAAIWYWYLWHPRDGVGQGRDSRGATTRG